MDPRKRAADAYGAFSDSPGKKNRKRKNKAQQNKKGANASQKKRQPSGSQDGAQANGASGDEFVPLNPPRSNGATKTGRQGPEHRPGPSEERFAASSGRQADRRAGGQKVPAGDAQDQGGAGQEYQTPAEAAGPQSGFFRTGFGPKKAAKLLLLLGQDKAAQVLRHLTSEEIEQITAEIAKIKRIQREEAKKILEEFGSITRAEREIRGGKEIARQILTASMGEEKGNAILRKVSPDAEDHPFSFLEELDYQQIMMLIRKEPPHVVSIILSHLQPKKSSELLESFPPDSQKEIVKRLAKMGRVAPEVLNSIEEKLKERLRTQGKVVTEEIEGERVLAEILKNMNVGDEERLLGSLDEQNSELAEEVREHLYSVDLIPGIPDYDMQKVLRDFEDRELAIMLKGKSEEVEDKILRNLSSRRRELIGYEREHLGRMKRSDVEEATGEFLRYLREMAERGEIALREDEYL
jgi:flagellar motor switch protein FliG